MNKPPIIQRAKAAWDVFRFGFSRRPFGDSKKSPFAFPVWRQGKAQWHIVDFKSYVGEGFNLNSLIYSAIMYKARAAMQVPLRAYSGDIDHPEVLPPENDLARLIARPNPNQSQREYMALQTVYLNISGNAYTLLDRPLGGGLPTAMHPLRPDRVYIIPEARGIKGYVYVPEGKSFDAATPILPADMMHVKLPNPGDPLDGMGYGLSPMSPLAQVADIDNMVTGFINTFFESGTMLNTYITFDQPMQETVLVAARDKFMEKYGGHKNWGKVAAFDSGGKVERFGMTFDEMGFEAIDERNESRIIGPFGVPAVLLETRSGLTGSTYANKAEARRMFWEDTMTSEISLHEDEMQYYLQGDGLFVQYDYSGVPALRRDLPKLITAWAELVRFGVSKNAAAMELGLNLGDMPDGDVVYMPLNLIPITDERPSSAEPDDEQPDEDENEPEAEEDERKGINRKAGFTPEQKAAHWKAADTISQSWEAAFSKAARSALENDKREIMAILGELKARTLAAKATVSWSGYLDDVNGYLDTESRSSWRSIFRAAIQGVMTDQGERWAADMGMSFDVQNLFARDWYNRYELRFAQDINETTKKTMSTLLAQAQAEGWPIQRMENNLSTVFEQWMDGDLSPSEFEWYAARMPAFRREMIARTETIRASNAGTWQLFSDWGVREHEWLSTKDDRVRESHASANGQVQPINAPFNVGGYSLMFPGDPDGPVSETINCRCTALPVLPGM